jgi:hypothetical protein
MGRKKEKAHRQLLNKHIQHPPRGGHQTADSNLAKSPNVAAAIGSTSSRPPLTPSHEDIAVEAEVLWRQEGCPKDRDDSIWLEAERQLSQVARNFWNEQDEKALSDPLSRLDLKSDDVMGELKELFPSPATQATTS